MVHKLDDLSLIIDTTIIEKEIDENQGTTVQSKGGLISESFYLWHKIPKFFTKSLS